MELKSNRTDSAMGFKNFNHLIISFPWAHLRSCFLHTYRFANSFHHSGTLYKYSCRS